MSWIALRRITRPVQYTFIGVVLLLSIIALTTHGAIVVLQFMKYSGLLWLSFEFLLRYPTLRPIKPRYSTKLYCVLYVLFWLIGVAGIIGLALDWSLHLNKYFSPIVLGMLMIWAALDDTVDYAKLPSAGSRGHGSAV